MLKKQTILLVLGALIVCSACFVVPRSTLGELKVTMELPSVLDSSSVVRVEVEGVGGTYSEEATISGQTAEALFELEAGSWTIYVAVHDAEGAPLGWTGTQEVTVVADASITATLTLEETEVPLFYTDFSQGLPAGWTLLSNTIITEDQFSNHVLRSTDIDGDSRSGPDLELADFSLEFRLRVEQFRGAVSRFLVSLIREDALEYQIWFQGDKITLGTATGPGAALTVMSEQAYAVVSNQWLEVRVEVVGGLLTLFVEDETVLSAPVAAGARTLYFWSWTALYALDDVVIWGR